MSASNSAFGNALLLALVQALTTAAEAHIAHSTKTAPSTPRKKRTPVPANDQ
jgi:hypothetical protein